MTFNPNGMVMITDFGNPMVVNAVAREAISGGQFVFSSGQATAVVDSGISSFTSADLTVATTASGAAFNGMAMKNQGSGTNAIIPVATNGLFIVTAAGSVVAGHNVELAAKDGVIDIYSGTAGDSGVSTPYNKKIGRAWTSASSGAFCVIQIGGI